MKNACQWITGEPQPRPVSVFSDPCQEIVCIVDDCVSLQSQGRVAEVQIRLKNICPGRRLALAVAITELDVCGHEQNRGMKIVTVPALHGTQCRDVIVQCIRFVLPDEPACCCNSHCRPRKFSVRTLANYLDGGFLCC